MVARAPSLGEELLRQYLKCLLVFYIRGMQKRQALSLVNTNT
jgi:hypothetical protein